MFQTKSLSEPRPVIFTPARGSHVFDMNSNEYIVADAIGQVHAMRRCLRSGDMDLLVVLPLENGDTTQFWTEAGYCTPVR